MTDQNNTSGMYGPLYPQAGPTNSPWSNLQPF